MRGRIEAWVRAVLHRFGALFERLGEVGLVTSGVVLAAQTFLALFPLLIALTAILPSNDSGVIATTLRSRLGLSGETDAAVQHLVAGRSDLRGGITVLGTIVVLASATSFTRALQRVYEAAWALPRLGLKGSIRGLVWLAGMVAYVALLGIALRLAGGGTVGSVLRTVLGVIGSVLLWWWTPFLLLLGRVRARALLPCGLLTAAATLILGRIATVVLPHSVRSNERQFGTIGVFFAVESWLVVVACTIVGVAVVSAVLGQTDGPLGHLARGSADVEGWRREPRRLSRRVT
jgi:membrane protein